jgi:hypothetical protein
MPEPCGVCSQLHIKLHSSVTCRCRCQRVVQYVFCVLVWTVVVLRLQPYVSSKLFSLWYLLVWILVVATVPIYMAWHAEALHCSLLRPHTFEFVLALTLTADAVEPFDQHWRGKVGPIVEWAMASAIEKSELCRTPPCSLRR